MEKPFLLGHKLPYPISKRLFGDRKKYGLKPVQSDNCWQELQKCYYYFYENTQKRSIGSIVNNSGYHVIKKIKLNKKIVLEIGPGNIDHINLWNGKPKMYYAVDANPNFLQESKLILENHNINYATFSHTIDEHFKLPIEDESIDVILSFYSLEHLHPLSNYLAEIHRVLRPGGILAGAIPIEGGLAWGIGRFLTSRRWLKKNTRINPDKIICWAHPNFADSILKQLSSKFNKQYCSYWPFKIPLLDINLVASFIYMKE